MRVLLLQVLPYSNYKVRSWKNGLGVTREIALHPPQLEFTSNDFLWRVSTAEVHQSGPFSQFENYDRVLVVLKGAGLSLSHDSNSAIELPTFIPYRFSGDAATHGELLSGPVTDLNVFVRRGKVRAEVEAVAVKGEGISCHSGAEWNFIFAACGSFAVKSVGQQQDLILNEGDTLRLLPDQAIRIVPQKNEGKIIKISLNPVVGATS